MKKIWIALGVTYGVILVVWGSVKELCNREINSTGGLFLVGYTGYVKQYCALSGLLEPLVLIGYVFLMLFVLGKLILGKREVQIDTESSE